MIARDPRTPACEPQPDGTCSICGDEGLVGVVVRVVSPRAARVRLADGEREVATDLVETVRRGDRLIVHLGFAIARVEPGGKPEPAVGQPISGGKRLAGGRGAVAP